MIPKTIHYCWFGRKPLPPLARRCIASWHKHMPDYEVKEWNEDNFDVNITPYTAQAYAAAKYAFVSDYARFWILYHEGGLYFDTDVEVVRPLDDIVSRGAFMGFEADPQEDTHTMAVAPGLGIGADAGQPLFRDFLDLYDTLTFDTRQMTTIVTYTTGLLLKKGLRYAQGIQVVEGVSIYPSEYFCPIDIVTKRLVVTPNTRTIHHYAGSWQRFRWAEALKQRFRRCLPESLLRRINLLKKRNGRRQ